MGFKFEEEVPSGFVGTIEGPTIIYGWEDKKFTVDFSRVSPEYKLVDEKFLDKEANLKWLHAALDKFLERIVK